MSAGTYYLARVVKLGELDQDLLMEALVDAPTVAIGKFEWTFTDVMDRRHEAQPYIFANLAKYSQEGTVTMVDEPSRRQVEAAAENLLRASAPFVYLPDFSGLAYLHVWNDIDLEVFAKRFASIVEAKFNEFFVGCVVEPITDYRAFLEKIVAFERVVQLSAKVYPPNPLFGRLWKSLDGYVRKRNAASVTLRESSKDNEGLTTNLVSLLESILVDPEFEPHDEPDIVDAAILMAADGYGAGKAVGISGGQRIAVRTSESQVNFSFDKMPAPEELALVARQHFSRLSVDRNMTH